MSARSAARVSPEGRRLAALLALLLLLLTGALSLGADSSLPRADFSFCNQDEPASLDPALATGFTESRVVGALFEGLTRLDPKSLEVLPGVARSWEVSDDGLSWSFHIRPEARWSNGEGLVAEDLRWSFLRLLAPGATWPSGSLLHSVVGARAYSLPGSPSLGDAHSVGIAAPRPDLLRITLQRPNAALPKILAAPALAPVHRASVERWGSAWAQAGRMVCNGPFTLELRRLKDRIRLARNPLYWGADAVTLERVDALTANGKTTQLNLYLTGAVDWMIKPPAGLFDELEGRSDLIVGPQYGSTFLRFNVRRPHLSDARVRRALSLALDRASLAHHVLRMGHRATAAYVPSDQLGASPPPAPVPDPERARELLAQAGYPGGAGLPTLELLFPRDESARDLCEAVAETWRRELGVNARLAVQTRKVYYDSSAQGLYDVAWSSWIGDWLDPANFLDVFHSRGASNRTGWAEPAYDELLSAAEQANQPAARAALLAQAERLLLRACPIAPIAQRVNVNLVSPRVTGFHDNLLDLHPLRDLAVTGPPP
ncbi:MAG: peptide ABC transporter substrate-binding protein [Planctomycetota bacterium]|nr:MAG: peptide ABC transporter substrate-binding protein [Planctomycetota bacterium]